MAQTWYTQWRDTRALRGEPISWEGFWKTFLDRFFPREKREAKVEEFINVYQGCMSVQEYSLKFVKLSKYAFSLLSNSRYEMSRFVTAVSDDLVEECHDEMLHNDMNLSLLIEHAQQVEESRLKRNNRNAKRARPYNGGTYKFGIQDKPKFKKRFSNKVPSNFLKANKDKVSNPRH